VNAADLEARIKVLEDHLRTTRDIQEIERLQRIYGYYLEHWMAREIIDLFADGTDTGLEWPEGKYNGRSGIRSARRRMRSDNDQRHL
jgi:hypothetical protein